MEQPERETGSLDDAQREVDERIDELAREGAEMEGRLEDAEESADDVPDPEESTEGGLGVSELTGGDDQSDS